MSTERRWMNWVLEMSATDSFEMPWARGARRARMIARRNDDVADYRASA